MGGGGRYIFDTHLKVASCCTRADNVANLQCNPQKQLTLWQMHCIQQGADKQTGKEDEKVGKEAAWQATAWLCLAAFCVCLSTRPE